MSHDGYCPECWAETPDGVCSCASEELPAGREGFDGIVDRLMFELGLDRSEAEMRAIAILEEDAA